MPGFLKPTTTPTPDELFDVWLSTLTGSELKVLLYIIRRTFGFGKDVDAISLSQIMKGSQKENGEVLDLGTGLSRKSAYQAVQSLERKELIVVGRALAGDGINEINTYSLAFKEGVGSKVTYGRGKIPLGVGSKATSQEADLSNIQPSLDASTSTDEDTEELVSAELETLIETCSREFGDMEHLESNLTRAFNLWAKTRFDAAEMLAQVQQARQTTKQRIGASAVKNRDKKMAYFFAVLEDGLGLKQAES